jgi:hypothetical protein
MHLFKTMLAALMAAVIYAPSALAIVGCDVLCTSQAANNICGNQYIAPLRIPLNPQPGPTPTTKMLVGSTISTQLEVLARFDNTMKIDFTAHGTSDAHFIFNINYGGGHSASYRLSGSSGICEQFMPAGASFISGFAVA